MVIRFKWYFLFLALILILAFILRFYKLSSIPNGFYFDEVTLGVDSYTIAHSLTDEFGNFAPDFFRIGADFRHPALVYITAPFVKILGLNIFAVRAPTALLGVLTVLLVYLLTEKLFKQKSLALLSALLLAISPWLINLSRSANDAIFALFFLLLADTLFVYGITQKKKSYIYLTYVFALLAWFSYSGAILMSTIHMAAFLAFAFLARSPRNIKFAALAVLIAFVIFPNCFYAFAGLEKLTGRFDQVSIFSSPGTKLVLQEQIKEDGAENGPIILTRMFHNKVTNYSIDLVNNYVTYLSPQFLLGQLQLPVRYKIDRAFLIYLFEPVFLLTGLYFLFKGLNWQKGFVVFMLLAAPIPAALTIEDTPNMQRAIFMIPALGIIIAYGIYNLFFVFKKFKLSRRVFTISILVLVAAYVYLFAYFMHQLFVHQPEHQNWFRDSQWQSASQLFQKLEPKYSSVYTNSPISYYYLTFYSESFRNFLLNSPSFKNNRSYKDTWQLGKYNFSSSNCTLREPKDVKPNSLYINGQVCDTPTWARVVGEAKSSDGTVILRFLDIPNK